MQGPKPAQETRRRVGGVAGGRRGAVATYVGRSRWFAVLAAVLAGLLSTAATASPSSPIVRTSSGPIAGIAEAAGVAFLGVPYAAPPLGDLRWRPPRPADRWAGLRDATHSPSPCPQTLELNGGLSSTSEDCLYLNVYVPAQSGQPRPLPVMVWVHGGGFTGGDGASYDPRRLATEGKVIVVTVNYRLGIFGNLALPGLADAGDFGLEDQQAALRWVRRNASAFGGDAAKLTVFGESAGGMSICALLTAPSSRGLFDRAIIESGSCLLYWRPSVWWPGLPGFGPLAPRAEVEAVGEGVAKETGCADQPDPLACLRAKPVETLLKYSGRFIHPAYETPLLPRDPVEALRRGEFLRVPVIFGGTRDEQRAGVAALERRQGITAQDLQQYMAAAFGASAPKVEAEYALANYASPALVWANATTDDAWACPTLEGDRLLAQKTRVFAYEFADRGAPKIAGMQDGPTVALGAPHASELAYLFNLGGLGGHRVALDAAQERLSSVMIGYWSRFAWTGDPNGPDLPVWRAFAAPGDGAQVQAFAPGPNGVGPIELSSEHHCAFWSSIPRA